MDTENIKKPGLVSFGNPDSKENMVNATALAKAFGKKPSVWLRLTSTKQFLLALAELKNIAIDNLVLKIKKNTNLGKAKGIWIHEDAALEFARWLSPSFAIWNNQHTKTLLLTGKADATAAAEPLPALASGLLQTIEFYNNIVDAQVRKTIYHDTVLQSRTLIPATVIAKELGMSARALNQKLHEKKIIYKNDSHWLLYADHQGKGYTGTKTALYIDSKGKYQSNIHTYWTEKGREFIHTLLHTNKQIA